MVGPLPAAGPSLSPVAPGPGRGEANIRCGGCAASFDIRAWMALPVLGTLTGDAISAHVVKWRKGVRIEIRQCKRCGRSIARTVAP